MSTVPGWAIHPLLRQAADLAAQYRNFQKFLIYGGWKEGKSYVLASAIVSVLKEHPDKHVVLIDGGEAGIQMYLPNPKSEPRLHIFSIVEGDDSPDTLDAATDLIIQHRNDISMVAVDGIDNLWAYIIGAFEERLHVEEIKGGNWRHPKKPWKRFVRTLQGVPATVGLTAKIKEVLFENTPGKPGQADQLTIRAIDAPSTERNVPYVFDIVFKTENVKDKKMRHTSKHQVSLAGFRRPSTIPASEMYIGRTWEFDGKKEMSEVNPWETIMNPWKGRWANEEQPAEVRGLDEEVEAQSENDFRISDLNEEVGRLVYGLKKCATVGELRDFWSREVAPVIESLPEDVKKLVTETKDELKNKLA